MAFWHSTHFNSPESITCPYWGRKDRGQICPKLKHNRCELPQQHKESDCRATLGYQPPAPGVPNPGSKTPSSCHVQHPHVNSGALAPRYQSAKDAGPETRQLKLQCGFWCPWVAGAIGSYEFTSALLPADYPAQRPSPVQAPQVSLASLRN